MLTASSRLMHLLLQLSVKHTFKMELSTFLGLKLKKVFQIFLSGLILLFVYPILFFVVISCWIYRILVQYHVQKDPKYGRLLTDIDGVFCGKDPYSKPLVVLMPYFCLYDRLDIPQVLEGLKSKVLEPGYYPELKQKIVKKYGYHFYCAVDNFKVEDHVTYLKPECPNMPVTREELRHLVTNKLGQVPFDPSRSPWQLMVATNYIDELNPEIKSVVILKVNHCLMDGYAISHFFQRFASKPWITEKLSLEPKSEPNKPIINNKWYQELCNLLWLLITGPYHALDMFLLSNDNHDFVKKSCDPFSKDSFKSQCTPSVHISRLKAVKNQYEVSLSALITTLFAQATYKSMKRASKKISNTIHGFLSFPIPGHPGTLTNHWSLVRIPVQVYEDDPLKTLKFVEKEFQSLKNSMKPLVFFYAMRINSIFPTYIRHVTECITPSVFVLTNFPGPMEQTDLFGCRGAQINLGGKPSKGTAFILGSFSYNSKFWFDGGGPSSNLKTQDDADYLANYILETLTALEKRK